MISKIHFLVCFLVGLSLSIFLPFQYFSFSILGFLSGILSGALFILIVEFIFRLYYFKKNNKPYEMIPKVPFDRICFEPHPFLPYVLKKNVKNLLTGSVKYPLNQDKEYKIDKFSTNSMGLCNGPDGTREVAIPKPKDIFRIQCLGASTTQYYVNYENKSYSYPLELEKILKEKCPNKNVEVINSGVPGYTSIEILIQFLLTVVDTEPDMVILYHSCNDIMASLTPNFRSDYSHSRRNLGETYSKYKTLSKFPYLPLAFYNHAVFPEMVHSLLHAVCYGTRDISLDFQGEQTYKRNIEHIIQICMARNIKMVLSTFCRYPYNEIKDDPGFQKLFQGISRENLIMVELAEKYSLPLVDSNNLIPREEKYFLDYVHFSPLGMEMLAQQISKPIFQYINKTKEFDTTFVKK